MLAFPMLYRPPGMPMQGYPRSRNCRACKEEFSANGPTHVRCPPCQAPRNAAARERATRKMRKKREAARVLSARTN